jgi:hypothetical protein
MLNSQRPIVRCHFLKVLLGDRLNRIFGALFEHLSLFLKDRPARAARRHGGMAARGGSTPPSTISAVPQ